MIWLNCERFKGDLLLGREICFGGTPRDDVFLGYEQEIRGPTETFWTSSWLRMGHRGNTNQIKMMIEFEGLAGHRCAYVFGQDGRSSRRSGRSPRARMPESWL